MPQNKLVVDARGEKSRGVDPYTLLHSGDLNGGVVKPIRVTGWRSGNKPTGDGILWGSPKGSAYGWVEWCLAEEYGDPQKWSQWWVHLDPTARLFTIDSFSDLFVLHRRYPSPDRLRLLAMDWPGIACDYDAVWLTEEGQWRTRMTGSLSLYGWDCESVVVLNHDVIERVEAIP